MGLGLVSTCVGQISLSLARDKCSDIKNLTKETLERQYELVKLRTSNNGTYDQGSHVMQFGDLVIDEEPAADYLGKLNTGENRTRQLLRQVRCSWSQCCKVLQMPPPRI